MKEVLDDIDRWRAAGKRVAVATGRRRRGLRAPDPGATMAVSEDGEVAGSVRAAASRVRSSPRRSRSSTEPARPRLCTFGYSDDEAFAVGLTCGGTLHVFVEPLDW